MDVYLFSILDLGTEREKNQKSRRWQPSGANRNDRVVSVGYFDFSLAPSDFSLIIISFNNNNFSLIFL